MANPTADRLLHSRSRSGRWGRMDIVGRSHRVVIGGSITHTSNLTSKWYRFSGGSTRGRCWGHWGSWMKGYWTRTLKKWNKMSLFENFVKSQHEFYLRRGAFGYFRWDVVIMLHFKVTLWFTLLLLFLPDLGGRRGHHRSCSYCGCWW